ncbi:Pleckstrin homology domain-containing protein [Lyophyllum atratum]|nr:Pleckstrin homology domain-containing protein [Lyophyllum atratum]
MASHHPPPSIAVSAADDPPPNPRHYDTHRRVFIGPMPEKVISQTEAHLKKKKQGRGIPHHPSQDEDTTDDVSDIIKQNAFTFFIREGGRPEDWGEDEERNVVEEMFRRWRSSEWANIWRHRQQNQAAAPTSRWVGGTFEVGRFLGVNILQDAESTRDQRSIASGSARRVSFAASRVSHDRPRSTASTQGQETFVTAPTGSHPVPSTSRLKRDVGTPVGSTSIGDSLPASSSTSLLRPALEQNAADGRKSQTEIIPRPILEPRSVSTISDGAVATGRKGKTKLVHYADIPEEAPAPPSEVLERTGNFSLQDTSAGAAAFATPTSPSPPSLDWGDVVLRDRMLVRTCYTKSESISPHFDEVQHRMTQNLVDADWGEYMVAWRRDRIELYCDYSLPGKEWLTGHKNLAFVIPLKSSGTQLSIYSFVDLTFCLACKPTKPVSDDSQPRSFFQRSKEGTNIFIFKHKSRSRAYDWIWQLWRQLGGQIPNTIDVRNPRLNTRVKIDIPSADAGNISQVFTRDNAIALTVNALRTVPGWNELIQRELKEGKSLQLAWRVDTNLDWIWLDDDVDGEERRWAVLCGLALKQSIRSATLEVRLAEHYPSHINLKNGSRLHEPPAIEGYVERIRPNSQAKQSMYLSTHDGNLFVMTPHHAYPPTPPGLTQNIGDIDEYAETLRKNEVLRGAMQIMHATGVNDLRSIMVIRRASQPTPEAMHKEASKSQESDIWFSIWSQSEERTPVDNEDEGGEEGLSKAEDKTQLRMRRCFELLLNTGRVVRFEVHSCRVAVEWIERLRALVLYWKQRHRIDAKEEMDLATSRRPRLTPLTRASPDGCELPPEAPPDTSAPMPALGSLYSWCVLDGCKPIVKGGKVYVRKGLYGQYKFVHLFLSAGHITRFRIAPRSSLHPSMHKRTNLVDAYVCSGYLAAMALPTGQYRASKHSDPRRYQDGLETDDPEEDMLFALWYRPQPVMVENPSLKERPSTTPLNVPSLSAKSKLLVFRTRSKLERDAWCWALNCEIEKLARDQKEREGKLRETGSLISL